MKYLLIFLIIGCVAMAILSYILFINLLNLKKELIEAKSYQEQKQKIYDETTKEMEKKATELMNEVRILNPQNRGK